MKFFNSLLDHYEKNRRWAVLSLALIMLAFYFIPFELIYFQNGLFAQFIVYSNALRNMGISGVYACWLTYSDFITPIFALLLFVFSVASVILALKFPKIITGSLAFFVYVLYRELRGLGAVTDNMASELVAKQVAYSVFLLLFTLAIIILIALILIAYCVHDKNRTECPIPPREHKPSKAERIAELEARVRELENREPENRD